MADLYGLEASGLPPELLSRYTGAQGKKKIAEALLQSSMSPLQVPSGNISWTQGLAKLVEAYAGRKSADKADEELRQIAQDRKTMVADAMSAYQRSRAGVPEQTAPFVADAFPGEDPIAGLKTITQPAVAPDKEGAYRAAVASGLPEMSRIAETDFKLDARKEDREDQQAFKKDQLKAQTEARAAEAEANRQARIQMLEQQIEMRKAMGQDANDLKLTIAKIMADSKQPPAPTMSEVVDPADPKRMLRVDARTYKGGTLGDVGVLGVSGKEASAAKKDEALTQGKEAVTGLLDNLESYYDQLNQKGAITSTKRGALSNIGSAMQNSTVGQMAGRATGTQEQSIRDQIAQARPMLLNSIKQATGMSAKQMDSNAELKLYLMSATDPSVGYEANKEALKNIRQFIVNNGKPPEAKSPANPEPKSGPSRVTNTAEYNALKPGTRYIDPDGNERVKK